MRELMLDELKQTELEVLCQIHNICQANNLRYSLCAGTLIGAVRHNGFIPWDDDVDIMMPRPDYNKLIQYCKTHETPFRLISHETNEKYGYLFAKACDPNTVLEEENVNRSNVPLGVCVDIFPVDGLADTYEDAVRRVNATRFDRELLVACNWKRFFRSKTRSWKYEPIRFAFYVFSRLFSTKKIIDRVEAHYHEKDFDGSAYAAVICGAYRQKEIMKKDIFTEYISVTFENDQFCAVRDYDSYLRNLYGDYMKLPPEEKRVAHHTFKAYRKDTL